MKEELLSREGATMIRRHVLEPGEAMPWHTDLVRRFTVVVRGERLPIEFRDGAEPVTVDVHAGLAEWDDPEPRVHRAVNAGSVPYEEVVIFFCPTPDLEPQPRHD